MSSERCKRALDALKSEAMPYVLSVVIRANQEDNDSYNGPAIVFSDMADAFAEMSAGCANQPMSRAKSILMAMDDQFADALIVMMYAGRDEFMDGHPYDAMNVDTQFSSWWDYLLMEGEHFAREQMGTKTPLGEYLRKGAYMFRIDIL